MAGDPDPSYRGINKSYYAIQINNLRYYSTVMMAAYRRTETVTGAYIWPDFISAFLPHTLRAWNRPMIVEWKALLNRRGIHADTNRESKQF